MTLKFPLKNDEILFVVLLGILSTTLGYQFGLGNQTEHLPLVLRLLDPSYLQNDFFVEVASGFGPRFYYVHFLAFLAQWLPLPLVVLMLALAVNTILGALTFLATRDLLNADRLAGFIAAILVVSVSSFPLGLVTDIRFIDFQPASLAIPGCLAAIWAGLRGKAVLAACLAAVSCLPHPLYGVETGAIAIATSFFVRIFGASSRTTKAVLARALRQLLTAFTILAGAAFSFWAIPQIGHSNGSMATPELINILAYFRAPHHYIPSYFPIEHYLALFFFLIAFVVGWSKWRDVQTEKALTLQFFLPPLFVLIGCIVGYVLIELLPARVGMIAQPFRMLYIVKWLGFLFLGWLIARWIREAGMRSSFGWIALLGSGAAHAVIAFLSVSAEFLDRRLRLAIPSLPRTLAPIGLFCATLWLLDRAGKIEETVLVTIAMALAVVLSSKRPHYWKRIVPIALVGLVTTAAIANRSTQAIDWRILNPVVTWDDHRGDHADVARWARQHSAKQSVFIVPPDMGTFRTLAQRAVVIDFEAVPFDDVAMRDWRTRIRDCYGEVTTGGFEAIRDLGLNYRRIRNQTLTQIAIDYDARYAVLYLETDTPRPLLYANSTYKVISLQAASATDTQRVE